MGGVCCNSCDTVVTRGGRFSKQLSGAHLKGSSSLSRSVQQHRSAGIVPIDWRVERSLRSHMRLHYDSGRCLPVFLELDEAPASGCDAAAHCVILLNVKLPRCQLPPSARPLPCHRPRFSPLASFSFWRTIWQVCQCALAASCASASCSFVLAALFLSSLRGRRCQCPI